MRVLQQTLSSDTQQTQDDSTPKIAGDADIVSLLIDIGVRANTASQLAKKYPLDHIRRQILWLPCRNPKKSKAGLAIDAIRGNWDEPEAFTKQRVESEAAAQRVSRLELDARAKQEVVEREKQALESWLLSLNQADSEELDALIAKHLKAHPAYKSNVPAEKQRRGVYEAATTKAIDELRLTQAQRREA